MFRNNRQRHRPSTEPETTQGPSIFDQSQPHHLNPPADTIRDLPDVGDVKEQLGFDRDDPRVTVRFVPLGRPGTIADIEDILRQIGGQIGNDSDMEAAQTNRLIPADRLTDGGYAETQPGPGTDVTVAATSGAYQKKVAGLERLDTIREPVFEVMVDVMKELMRAVMKHGPQKSPHEGYAVLLEEVDELWDEIKRDGGGRNAAARAEAIQIAAMAIRYVIDNIDVPQQ